MGIEVLPPDVNSSDHDFVVSGNSIRFGLDAVKNVGYAAVEAILAAREAGGGFASIWDFCERVDARTVNKQAIECLIKCGALDSTGATRQGMLEVLPRRRRPARRRRRTRRRGQGSIFDLGGEAEAADAGPAAPARTRRARRGVRAARAAAAREGDARHLPLGHPLAEVRDALRARVDCSLPAVGRSPDGAWVTVGGIITEAKKVRTRAAAT